MPNPPAAASALLPYHQTGIKDIDVVDMKWSPAGDVFFILFQRHLFAFEPKTQKFTQIHVNRHKDYPYVRLLNSSKYSNFLLLLASAVYHVFLMHHYTSPIVCLVFVLNYGNILITVSIIT